MKHNDPDAAPAGLHGPAPAQASVEGVPEDSRLVDTGSRLDGVRLFRRREQKYEVGSGAAAFLREEIGRRLPRFEFDTGHPTTFITTVYFDTQGRDFYHLAERSYDDNVKIRVKEYYYPLSGAAPLTDGAGVLPLNGSVKYLTSPYCYVELKQSASGLVIKKRFGILKRDLALLLRGEDVWPILLRMTPSAELKSLEEVYTELSRYLKTYSVGITSVVNYRRSVYQESEEALRITFDDQLCVYAPPDTLYEDMEALTPEILGKPVRRSEKVILEIKCPGEYPEWLRNAMRHHSTRRLSKFTASVRLLISGGGGSNGGSHGGSHGGSNGGLAAGAKGPNGDHSDSTPRPPRHESSGDSDTEQMAGFFN